MYIGQLIVQDDLLGQMLEQNAGKRGKALGLARQQGGLKVHNLQSLADFGWPPYVLLPHNVISNMTTCMQGSAPQRLVSDASSSSAVLSGPATQADNPVEKAAEQVPPLLQGMAATVNTADVYPDCCQRQEWHLLCLLQLPEDQRYIESG